MSSYAVSTLQARGRVVVQFGYPGALGVGHAIMAVGFFLAASGSGLGTGQTQPRHLNWELDNLEPQARGWNLARSVTTMPQESSKRAFVLVRSLQFRVSG